MTHTNTEQNNVIPLARHPKFKTASQEHVIENWAEELANYFVMKQPVLTSHLEGSVADVEILDDFSDIDDEDEQDYELISDMYIDYMSENKFEEALASLEMLKEVTLAKQNREKEK